MEADIAWWQESVSDLRCILDVQWLQPLLQDVLIAGEELLVPTNRVPPAIRDAEDGEHPDD
jgi:hypothetical protein